MKKPRKSTKDKMIINCNKCHKKFRLTWVQFSWKNYSEICPKCKRKESGHV